MSIDDLFYIHNARSKGFQTYSKGKIPFISNGFGNNGVVGLVTPRPNDRVFDFDGICISAFCEVTVHKAPFLPRGNGGSGLTVLQPKKKLAFETLLYVASYLNSRYRWKFSYGRMVVENRIKKFEVNIPSKIILPQRIDKLIPKKHTLRLVDGKINFKRFSIQKFFTLEHGDFHALDKLKSGKIPTVSRITTDNGIVGFYNKPTNANMYKKGTITISTTSGDAFLQLDDFILTDNVVILIPKREFSVEELLFIVIMLNLEKWRISYGRQGYKGIFSKTSIFLPVCDNGDLNNSYINEIVRNSYHFKSVQKCLKN